MWFLAKGLRDALGVVYFELWLQFDFEIKFALHLAFINVNIC